jgi:tetratricopeptide (TPR) repeat protein
MGSALTALSSFFDTPWRKLADELKESDKGYVLNNVGFCLRALGWLVEVAQPLQAGLEARIADKDWKNAAVNAYNLVELHLTIGDVKGALAYTEQSVQFADKSGDMFTRSVTRAYVGNLQHQAGNLIKAQAAFSEAEEIKKQMPNKVFPILASISGFQ